jgi:hypothetical protein
MQSWIAVLTIVLSVVSLVTSLATAILAFASIRSDVRNMGTLQEQQGERIKAIEGREGARDAAIHRMDKNIALICQKLAIPQQE